jgi:hypothetical protein
MKLRASTREWKVTPADRRARARGRSRLGSIDTRTLRVRRGYVYLLMALCVFLTSGAASIDLTSVVQVPADPASAGHVPAFVSPSHRAAGRIAETLGTINPSLSLRDRARIGTAIERYSAAYGLDPDLVLAVVIVESDARPWAHSPKGAVGLMQVMPHMMQPMGLAGNLATIESNIEAGCFILSHNIRRLGVEDGISAYFWGSDIRGVAYLEKVLETRSRVKQLAAS